MAVMEGDIAYIILNETRQIVTPYLGHIYWETFTLRSHPAQSKQYDTCMLQKPGTSDYVVAKSYQLIILLKPIAKALSMAVAEDISYILEKHHLLPQNHFGA